MANRRIETVPIDSNGILENIQKAGLSIRKVAKKINRSDRTIRTYLTRGEMPLDLIHEIDNVVRPKKNPLLVHFNVCIMVSDEELNTLAYADEITEEKYTEIELCGYNAEALWDLRGETEFLDAVIPRDPLKDLIREKLSPPDGNKH